MSQEATRESLGYLINCQKSILRDLLKFNSNQSLSVNTLKKFLSGEDIRPDKYNIIHNWVEKKRNDILGVKNAQIISFDGMFDCSKICVQGVIIRIGDMYCGDEVITLKSNIQGSIFGITTKSDDGQKTSWEINTEDKTINEK